MGEGLFIGRRFIFVRFKGCPLNCIYCDEYKKYNKINLVEEKPGTFKFKKYDNLEDNLTETILKLKTNDLFAVSFTGGEPLLYYEKIENYAKELKKYGIKIHLESSGIYPNRINYPYDYASIDIKLMEHFKNIDKEKYYEIYENELKSLKKLYRMKCNVYAKMVIMEDTSLKTVEIISQDIESIGDIPLCIQPVSPTYDYITPPSKEKIFKIMDICGKYLSVMCVPQVHKIMNIL